MNEDLINIEIQKQEIPQNEMPDEVQNYLSTIEISPEQRQAIYSQTNVLSDEAICLI